MKKIIISIIITILLLMSFAIRTQIIKRNEINAEIKIVSTEIEDINKEINKLEKYETKEPIVLNEVFSTLINQKNILSTFHDVDFRISIPNSKDKEEISKYFKDSKFSMIKKLPIEIFAQNILSEIDYGLILDTLYQMEQQLDIEVTEIKRKEKNITISGFLYGIRG